MPPFCSALRAVSACTQALLKVVAAHSSWLRIWRCLCCSNYSQIQGRLGSTPDSERTMGRMTQGVGSYFATQSAIDEVKYTKFARLLQCKLGGGNWVLPQYSGITTTVLSALFR